jgi:hypothetical protein
MNGFKNPELQKICDDLGVLPQQIIFFDDSGKNIEHANVRTYPVSFIPPDCNLDAELPGGLSRFVSVNLFVCVLLARGPRHTIGSRVAK